MTAEAVLRHITWPTCSFVFTKDACAVFSLIENKLYCSKVIFNLWFVQAQNLFVRHAFANDKEVSVMSMQLSDEVSGQL